MSSLGNVAAIVLIGTEVGMIAGTKAVTARVAVATLGMGAVARTTVAEEAATGAVAATAIGAGVSAAEAGVSAAGAGASTAGAGVSAAGAGRRAVRVLLALGRRGRSRTSRLPRPEGGGA